MQANDTRLILKRTLQKLQFSAIASIATSLFTIARLKKNPKEQKLNNAKRLIYSPVCWQCGAEKGLLKLHSSGVLYVCRSCRGEQ